jgi:hypothetical protein
MRAGRAFGCTTGKAFRTHSEPFEKADCFRLQRHRTDASPARLPTGRTVNQIIIPIHEHFAETTSAHGLVMDAERFPSANVCGAMGSLIKKRRKRMRKKKHKKMLKRTRWQRRAK